MSELKDQLKKIVERVNELENNPSELTKDALLAEVIGFYDVAKATKLNARTDNTPEPKAPLSIHEPEPELIPKVVVRNDTVEPPQPPVEQEASVESEAPVEKTEEPVAEAKEEPLPSPIPSPAPVPASKTPKAQDAPRKGALIGKDEPDTKASDKKILAGQFNKTPIQNLRSEIPLNEKFGIIRNLFKGNASDFGDAVLKLNNAANAKEITHYLELLSQRFEWDLESEAYKNFTGYVNRKMMSLAPSKTADE